ncbi:HD domain-containing phosphohydrolase [Peptostreptococcaceae bacterium AGR-M142]
MFSFINLNKPIYATEEYKKNILVLHSYSRDYPWTENLQMGVENLFKDYMLDVNYRIEYMDTKNYFSDKYIEQLRDIYKEKYFNVKFDFIIATDNNALNFLIDYKDELFGENTPVVATGINNIHLINVDSLAEEFYVVEEKPDYKKGIDLAISQNKQAKNIYFILDDTTTSQLVKEELNLILNDYNKDYNITFLRDISDSSFDNFISSLDKDDILFFVLYFKDSKGQSYLYDELIKKYYNISKIPIYVFWDFYLDKGALGGHVASAEYYGEMAAKKVYEVMTGDTTTKIIYDYGKFSKYLFDYRLVKKFNITNLPKNSEFINKPQSYYEMHKTAIWFGVVTSMILCIIILLLLRVIKDKVDIEKQNKEIHDLNTSIIKTQKDMIETLGDVIETKSEGTANHVRRVAKISRFLAEEYGLTKKDAEVLELISPMHDVGKIGISENILHKPDKLTDEEFEVMKFHTTIGHQLLNTSNREFLKLASTVAHEHHERWDGRGYPNHLKGAEISILARITTVADIYDALRSKRPYKKSWPLKDVIEYFKEEKGKIFEPKLVDIFIENIDIIEQIRGSFSDEHSDSKTLLYDLNNMLNDTKKYENKVQKVKRDSKFDKKHSLSEEDEDIELTTEELEEYEKYKDDLDSKLDLNIDSDLNADTNQNEK